MGMSGAVLVLTIIHSQTEAWMVRDMKLGAIGKKLRDSIVGQVLSSSHLHTHIHTHTHTHILQTHVPCGSVQMRARARELAKRCDQLRARVRLTRARLHSCGAQGQ